MLLENTKVVLKTDAFMKSYGTLLEGLKIDQYSAIFYPIYLFRRVIYSAILVILYEYPYIQISVIIFIVLIPVFFIN